MSRESAAVLFRREASARPSAKTAAVAASRTILHAFPTFQIGGAQMRFVQLANRFGARYRHLIVAMDGETAAKERLDPSLDVTFLPVTVTKGRTLRDLPRFGRMLCDLQPDLLVTSNWGAIDWAMANVSARIPHLHMEDGFGPDEAETQLPRRVWTRRLVLRRSTVLLPSRTLVKIARDLWKLPRRKLAYVPNGIDCARFQAAPDLEFAMRYGIRRDIPVIGSIGGLRAEKNLTRLLDAFVLVLTSRPAQLVIVGSGPQAEALKQAAEQRGLGRNVVFTGAHPKPERLLPLFTAFALSSDTEQMPLSILEAMAASRAIASTDVGDVREMVAEENRLFVVPRDVGALAAAILSLLADPAKASEIGRANRKHAVEHFDESRMLAAYRRLFDGELTVESAAP